MPAYGTILTPSHPDTRLALLQDWLRAQPAALALDIDSLRPASADASFRRYFRLDTGAGTAIVMDAPPPNEDCRPFLHVADLLRQAGVNVPAILARDVDAGLLLLSDLGDATYYQCIRAGLTDTVLQAIYRDALAELVRLQGAATTGLPAYDAPRLADELALFPEWYAGRHCGATLDASARNTLGAAFETLVAHNSAQPVVLVHRDFHSPNLMRCTEARHGRNPGVLDFQDAVAGPISYDIASLVTDARTTWDEAQQLDWAIRYWDMARQAGLPVPADFADFHRDYEWMALQRNLRILGVFARLYYRDGKPGYIRDHMPRVNTYVRQVASRYRPFLPLMRLLDKLDAQGPAPGVVPGAAAA